MVFMGVNPKKNWTLGRLTPKKLEEASKTRITPKIYHIIIMISPPQKITLPWNIEKNLFSPYGRSPSWSTMPLIIQDRPPRCWLVALLVFSLDCCVEKDRKEVKFPMDFSGDWWECHGILWEIPRTFYWNVMTWKFMGNSWTFNGNIMEISGKTNDATSKCEVLETK